MMRPVVIVVAIVAMTTVACSGGGEPAPPSASLPISLGPSSLPTAAAGAATGRVTTGTASVTLTGDLGFERAFDALAAPNLYTPPPGAMAIAWSTAAGSESLVLTGETFVGARPTATGLTLTLTVLNGTELVVLGSSAGECTITIDTADATSISGNFACDRIAGATATGGLSADATGTFSASG